MTLFHQSRPTRHPNCKPEVFCSWCFTRKPAASQLAFPRRDARGCCWQGMASLLRQGGRLVSAPPGRNEPIWWLRARTCLGLNNEQYGAYHVNWRTLPVVNFIVTFHCHLGKSPTWYHRRVPCPHSHGLVLRTHFSTHCWERKKVQSMSDFFEPSKSASKTAPQP